MKKEELQRLIVKYEITLGSRRNERVLIDHVDPNSILEIRNNHKMTEADYDILKKEKPNILTILHEEAERRKQEADERQAKINAIEGVAELETAIADFNKACKDYETKIEWYIYDGRCSKDFQPEKYPSASKVLALRKKYPKAVAYLKAKKWSESISARQALFGARATERILNGEDYEQVIAEMERDELLDSRARDVLERPALAED